MKIDFLNIIYMVFIISYFCSTQIYVAYQLFYYLKLHMNYVFMRTTWLKTSQLLIPRKKENNKPIQGWWKIDYVQLYICKTYSLVKNRFSIGFHIWGLEGDAFILYNSDYWLTAIIYMLYFTVERGPKLFFSFFFFP